MGVQRVRWGCRGYGGVQKVGWESRGQIEDVEGRMGVQMVGVYNMSPGQGAQGRGKGGVQRVGRVGVKRVR